jgi:hypothetical protein
MIKTTGCKFDKKQLQMGIKVELEHTTNPKVAERIAKQHLCEFKNKPYYTALSQMEKRLKK